MIVVAKPEVYGTTFPLSACAAIGTNVIATKSDVPIQSALLLSLPNVPVRGSAVEYLASAQVKIYPVVGNSCGITRHTRHHLSSKLFRIIRYTRGYGKKKAKE